jgi:peptide/nickel transport system ATP-binding protein/oligopeptide transport system ATP-binding protein
MSESPNGSEELLVVKNLVKYFPVRGGFLQRVQGWVQAVDDVSFSIREGETLSLVGESGCGKTTVGRSILRLIEPTSGSVSFEGTDLLSLSQGELKEYRRNPRPVLFTGSPENHRRVRGGRVEDSWHWKRQGAP